MQQLPWRQFERWAKGATIEIQCEFESIEMLDQKRELSEKNSSAKKNLVRKTSWSKNYLVKKNLIKNYVCPQILGQKIFWGLEYFWSKKRFGSKKRWPMAYDMILKKNRV